MASDTSTTGNSTDSGSAYEARRARLGKVLHQFEASVERGRLRLFAKAIGETDPIYIDETAARRAGYADVVVPPTFIYCLSEEVADPNAVFEILDLDISKVFQAEQEIALTRPVCAGETVLIVTRLADYFEKRDGQLRFVKMETELTGENGQSVGQLVTTVIVKEPD